MSLFHDTHEHPQTGTVRFVQETTDKGVAVWYDFNGDANVTNDWLCAHMAEVYPGTWAVTKRHAGGNSHNGVDLHRVQVTQDGGR